MPAARSTWRFLWIPLGSEVQCHVVKATGSVSHTLANAMSDKLAKFERGALVHVSLEDKKIALRLPEHLHGLKQALTVEEVATLLQVSQRHVYALVQSGAMPHFKVGSAVRFDPDTLAEWLQGLMKNSAPGKKPGDQR